MKWLKREREKERKRVSKREKEEEEVREEWCVLGKHVECVCMALCEKNRKREGEREKRA